MGQQGKNIICEPKDALGDLRREIMELISLRMITCDNLPSFNIPNGLPAFATPNLSMGVIDLLKDILALVQGINFEQMRLQLIDWLVEQIGPLERSLALNFKLALKECFACQITPTIPHWLFFTDPQTGTAGAGINIEINKIDLTCLFSVNPNSEAGQLLYDGTSQNDLNRFLWDVIQANGQPLLWKDPITQKDIAHFTFLEDDNTAYTTTSNIGGAQNQTAVPMVFKMQIADIFQTKNLITFINDYVNSCTPLFDTDKVIPNTINFIFGTISGEIKMPDECLAQVVELETAIEDYINVGINDCEVEVDNSFYSFSPEQMADIKNKVAQKKNGVKLYEKCCNKQISKIPFNDLVDFNEKIKTTNSTSGKLEVYSDTLNKMANNSSSNVAPVDEQKAKDEYWSNFITGLQVAITKMFLSPKNLMLSNTLYFLVNNEPVQSTTIKGMLKSLECVFRVIIGDLINKLIYEFLLPLIIKALTNIIICYITKKLKEKQVYHLLTLKSLLPGFIAGKIDKINQVLGKAGQITGQLQGFSNQINLNSLNNINLKGLNIGKFCD
mgnify:CR=1 FL=1